MKLVLHTKLYIYIFLGNSIEITVVIQSMVVEQYHIVWT